MKMAESMRVDAENIVASAQAAKYANIIDKEGPGVMKGARVPPLDLQ